MTLLSSSPQHCLKGEGGEIKLILDCFQIVYYDLTIRLNIFCEGYVGHQTLILRILALLLM